MSVSLRKQYADWIGFLRQEGIESASFEVDLLLEECLGVHKAMRLLRPDLTITPEQKARIDTLLHRRICGEPLQYLLGRWDFYGRSFLVGPGVLIPRADTEILVEHALEKTKAVAAPVIADLCAGTGCVGITMACQRPDAQVYLMELSDPAADYCKKNLAALAPQAHFVKRDVLIPTADLPLFDAVLSNPPYIPTADLQTLQKEVRHEPAMALDGDKDGLRFYRGITAVWREKLVPGGLLAYEIGYDQAQAVSAILEEHNFMDITVLKDYAGNNRVVSGIKR